MNRINHFSKDACEKALKIVDKDGFVQVLGIGLVHKDIFLDRLEFLDSVGDVVIFNLESNPDVGFYALYASLRMFKEFKALNNPADAVSMVSAECFCMLSELESQHPEKSKEAAKEYNLAYSNGWIYDKAPTLVELENKRAEWALKEFPAATAKSSLIKARGEIDEIDENIDDGVLDPIEYVDAIMCLFDSAKRQGLTAAEIVEAYGHKNLINFGRTWVKNPDNTYSHVKTDTDA